MSRAVNLRDVGRWSGFVAFLRDEDGDITIFILVAFVMILIAMGMGVDFMRHEMLRADLQNAMDRGTLAATNLAQTYDQTSSVPVSDQAKLIVQDYVARRRFSSIPVSLNVNVTPITGGRSVTASATMAVDTTFLQLAGIPTLGVATASKAEQGATNTEIVLVLDISGSMTRDSSSAAGTKLEQLIAAAQEFVNTIYDAPNSSRTVISVVPYSSQVAIPPVITNRLTGFTREHSYSTCVEHLDLDYTSTSIPLAGTYRQVQHFRETTRDGVRIYGCPDDLNAILPYSANRTVLNRMIGDMRAENWTATYVGAKWGAALLDPAMKPVVDSLVGSGALPARFSGTPRAWDDTSVQKILVVMSDGQNTKLHRIRDDQYAARGGADYYNNNNPGSDKYAEIDNDVDGRGDTVMQQICSAVKPDPLSTDPAKRDRNSIVYTIGFEVDGSGADEVNARAQLSACASTTANFYNVRGTQIRAAFKDIANSIINLKLTN